MSRIIKSFRVIENIEASSEEEENKKIDGKLKPLIIEAKKEAEDIVQKAKTNAENIIKVSKDKSLEIINDAEEKKENFLHDAYDKAKDICSDAKKEGFKQGYDEGKDLGHEEGYNLGKEEANKIIREALEIKEEYSERKKNLLKDLEKDIIELVTVVYERLIDKKTEEDDELILSLVLKGIENLDLNHKLTIITSRDDYDVVEMSRDFILAKSNMISELNIKYDSNLKKGDCILETDQGSIDVSLDTQMKEVRELLTLILNNE